MLSDDVTNSGQCPPNNCAYRLRAAHHRHAAAVSLYVTHYNLCRVHEALRTTPGVALGVADRVWTIGDLIDAVLPLEPNRPVRVRRNFTVIDGGKLA
jgi:hypothetical protein